MKIFYPLFLFIIVFASRVAAQSNIKTVTDKFTSKEIKSLAKPIIIKTGTARWARVDIIYSDGIPTLTITSNDPDFGCTLEHHIVKILFDDDLSYSAYNVNRKCNGLALVPMDNEAPVMNKQLFYKLQINLVKSIRIENDQTFFDFDIPNAEAIKFRKGAIELFGGRDKGIGIPIDSSAPIPKRARLPKLSSNKN